MKILVVTPVMIQPGHPENVEPIGEITREWMKEFVPILEGKGHDVTLLTGQETTRGNVERAIREGTPDFFTFFDHGSMDALLGTGDYIGRFGPFASVTNTANCIDTRNCAVLRRVHAFAEACLSAMSLGPAAVDKGCSSYAGYVLPSMVGEPPWDEPYKLQSFAYPYAVADGKTLGEAFNIYNKVTYEQASKLVTQLPYGLVNAIYLMFNSLHFRLTAPEGTKERPIKAYTISEERRAIAQIEEIKRTLRAQLVRLTAEEGKKPFISIGARTLTLEQFLTELDKGPETVVYEALAAGLIELYRRSII